MILFDFFDREGAMSMGFAFYGPIGAIAFGIAFAVWFVRRAGRTRRGIAP